DGFQLLGERAALHLLVDEQLLQCSSIHGDGSRECRRGLATPGLVEVEGDGLGRVCRPKRPVARSEHGQLWPAGPAVNRSGPVVLALDADEAHQRWREDPGENLPRSLLLSALDLTDIR